MMTAKMNRRSASRLTEIYSALSIMSREQAPSYIEDEIAKIIKEAFRLLENPGTVSNVSHAKIISRILKREQSIAKEITDRVNYRIEPSVAARLVPKVEEYIEAGI